MIPKKEERTFGLNTGYFTDKIPSSPYSLFHCQHICPLGSCTFWRMSDKRGYQCAIRYKRRGQCQKAKDEALDSKKIGPKGDRHWTYHPTLHPMPTGQWENWIKKSLRSQLQTHFDPLTALGARDTGHRGMRQAPSLPSWDLQSNNYFVFPLNLYHQISHKIKVS